MQPFHHFRINTVDEAVQLASQAHQRGQAVRYLAGGTTLVDLMRLEVINPLVVIDLGNLLDSHTASARVHDGRLSLSAFASMAEVERDPVVRRQARSSQSHWRRRPASRFAIWRRWAVISCRKPAVPTIAILPGKPATGATPVPGVQR